MGLPTLPLALKPDGALDRQVVGLRRAGGEHDLPGFGTDDVGDFGPGLLDRLLRRPAIAMLA